MTGDILCIYDTIMNGAQAHYALMSESTIRASTIPVYWKSVFHTQKLAVWAVVQGRESRITIFVEERAKIHAVLAILWLRNMLIVIASAGR